MGVPGLWEVLRPAGHTRSFTHLSVVDGFERNRDNLRGYRVGIDASIWIYHSEWGREGENPQLRTIFFRCVKLMNSPFLPLFVFDGPGRPGEKRGKKINKGKPHSLIEGLKRLITAFGYEWRTVRAYYVQHPRHLIKKH
jgi:Holliday junction resolvase YEN1